jgi:hypothetical protein
MRRLLQAAYSLLRGLFAEASGIGDAPYPLTQAEWELLCEAEAIRPSWVALEEPEEEPFSEGRWIVP